MSSRLLQPTSPLSSATACLVCAICDSPLIPEPAELEGKEEEDVSGLKCGHVFHKNCLNQWMCRRKNCPNCRSEITEDDVVPKLFFNSDEGQAVQFSKTSRQASEAQAEEEKPWYEKYKDELLIGGGALLGFAAGALITAMNSSGKKKK